MLEVLCGDDAAVAEEAVTLVEPRGTSGLGQLEAKKDTNPSISQCIIQTCVCLEEGWRIINSHFKFHHGTAKRKSVIATHLAIPLASEGVGVAVYVAKPGSLAGVRVEEHRPLGRCVRLDNPLAVDAVPEHLNVEVNLQRENYVSWHIYTHACMMLRITSPD